MASCTMAFDGFSVESSDSLEAELLFFIFFPYAVQQDIQLTLTPFFMFLQELIHGVLRTGISLKTHILNVCTK